MALRRTISIFARPGPTRHDRAGRVYDPRPAGPFGSSSLDNTHPPGFLSGSLPPAFLALRATEHLKKSYTRVLEWVGRRKNVGQFH